MPGLFPPPSAVVGRVVISLTMGGRFAMESDIQDAKQLCEMLRACADSLERTRRVPPGKVLIEGNEAIPVAASNQGATR